MAISTTFELLLMVMDLAVSAMYRIVPPGLVTRHSQLAPRQILAGWATDVCQTPVVLPPGVLFPPTWPKSRNDCAPSDPSNLMPLLLGPSLISWIRSLFEPRSVVAASPSMHLCMRFLTKGFSCSDTKCKRPHVPNLNTLPKTDRKKVVDFVAKTRFVLGAWTNPCWCALNLLLGRFHLSPV